MTQPLKKKKNVIAQISFIAKIRSVLPGDISTEYKLVQLS